MTRVRIYVHDGLIYVFRDVREPDGGSIIVQYATTQGDKVRWTDCREGSDFEEVEPLGSRVKGARVEK